MLSNSSLICERKAWAIGFTTEKNRDLDFGIADYLLDRTGERDNGRLVMKARLQIDIAVRIALDLATAFVKPRVIGVFAPTQAR